MKRLLVRISHDNLSTYVDTFFNHGMNLSFPWLIAHHFIFFQNFDRLDLLEVLLRHKRGYSCGLGSKIRKLYFSDVNRILDFHKERKVSCCESFPETTSFKKSEAYSHLSTTIHEVSGTEGITETDDINVSLLDFTVAPPAVEKRLEPIIMTDEKESDPKFMNFFKRITKKLKSMTISDFVDKELEQKALKEAEYIKLSLKDLNDRMNLINKTYKEMEYKMTRVYSIDELDTNDPKETEFYKNFRQIMQFLLNYLEHYDYVFEPVLCQAPLIRKWLRTNKTSKFGNQVLRACIEVFVERKREKQFMLLGELEQYCKSLNLQSRVEYFNKNEDELEDLVKLYKKQKDEESRGIPRSAPLVKMSDLKLHKQISDSLSKEVKPLIGIYEAKSKLMFDVENYLSPLVLRNLLQLAEKEPGMMVEVNRTLLSIDEDLNKVAEILRSVIEQWDDGGVSKEDYRSLRSEIRNVYREVREYILTTVNKNERVSREVLDQKYSKITDLRSDFMRSSEGRVINIEKHLSLTQDEFSRLEIITEELEEIGNNMLNMSEVVNLNKCNYIYNEHNKRILAETMRIRKDLPEEDWKNAVMMFDRNSKIDTLNDHMAAKDEYKKIVGVDPYGFILGSSYKFKCDPLTPLSSKRPFWRSDMLDNLVQTCGMIRNEELQLSDVRGSYLEALVRNKSPNSTISKYDTKANLMALNLDIEKNRISEINKLERESRKIIQNKSKELLLYERVQDIFSGNECSGELETKGWVKVNLKTKGKKIEKDLESRKLRRKNCDNERFKILKEASILSKNKYEELDVEEAHANANEIVDSMFKSDLSVYYCYDFKRKRSYNTKKNQEISLKKSQGVKGLDLIKEYNNFDVENNSNSNKNHSVAGLISYIKLLVAFKLLKINTKRVYYQLFGLKKCQSTYLMKSLSSLAERMILNIEIHNDTWKK